MRSAPATTRYAHFAIALLILLVGDARAQKQDPFAPTLTADDIKTRFKDILLSDAQVASASGAAHGKLFEKTMAELEKLTPHSRLPEPILLSQAVRYFNEEIKRSKLKYRIYLRLLPVPEDDPVEYLTDLLLKPLSSDEERVQAYRDESIGKMLSRTCSTMNASLLIYDNGIVVIAHRVSLPE
jgi:hypothetical protein